MVVAEYSQETSVMAEDHRHLDASNNGEIINITDDGVMNSLSTTPDDHQPGADSPQSIEYTAHERPEGIKKVVNTENYLTLVYVRIVRVSGYFLLHKLKCALHLFVSFPFSIESKTRYSLTLEYDGITQNH